MARPIRVEFANAVYHVTARGNERKAIVRDDPDRERFLETLEETVGRFGVVLHAYCLMPNHYHLLLQTPRANLSDAVGWFQTTYTVRFNRRHRRSGHLYQGRFKAHLVEADAYARQLVKYIHLNPVRPQDKKKPIPGERSGELEAYPWSSHPAYAGRTQAAPPAWLCLDWLSYFGRTRRVAQAEYRREMAAAFGEVLACQWTELRQGMVLGGESFWNRARQSLEESAGEEEIRWRRRADRDEMLRRIAALTIREADWPVAVWLQVRVGGQRMTELAKDYGYRDGRGVHRVVQRLEQAAQAAPVLGGWHWRPMRHGRVALADSMPWVCHWLRRVALAADAARACGAGRSCALGVPLAPPVLSVRRGFSAGVARSDSLRSESRSARGRHFPCRAITKIDTEHWQSQRFYDDGSLDDGWSESSENTRNRELPGQINYGGTTQNGGAELPGLFACRAKSTEV